MEGQKTELKMIRMSEVETQEVKWLWYPFIPYGKLTIIQGDPGDGKTTLVLNIAAKLSKGESLDRDMNVQEPVNVIYQTAEDGLADTVKPRLELAGADCEKILVIDESDKSLSMADERLEEALAKTGVKVLILDPIQAYLGGGMDMNRANEARDMTKKLGALAEKYQCAILLIGHMNKASGNKAAYRGMGSIDFFAVARSVLLVGRIEGEPNIKNYVFSTHDTHSELCDAIRISKGYRKEKWGYFLRAESFYNVATKEEEYADLAHPSAKYHEKSHGESFLALAQNNLHPNGLYLFDEPEAALSPQRQLTLLMQIYSCAKEGAQFIIVTHSPILLGIPDADIYCFDNGRIHLCEYEDTESYQVTEMFINNRQMLLDRLLTD